MGEKGVGSIINLINKWGTIINMFIPHRVAQIQQSKKQRNNYIDLRAVINTTELFGNCS